MIYVTRIKMKGGCGYSTSVEEIDQLYLEGGAWSGYYSKESLYDYLMKYPETITVGVYPYPPVIPAKSGRGEKYVKSTPNGLNGDNLLRLPREWGGCR